MRAQVAELDELAVVYSRVCQYLRTQPIAAVLEGLGTQSLPVHMSELFATEVDDRMSVSGDNAGFDAATTTSSISESE